MASSFFIALPSLLHEELVCAMFKSLQSLVFQDAITALYSMPQAYLDHMAAGAGDAGVSIPSGPSAPLSFDSKGGAHTASFFRFGHGEVWCVYAAIEKATQRACSVFVLFQRELRDRCQQQQQHRPGGVDPPFTTLLRRLHEGVQCLTRHRHPGLLKVISPLVIEESGKKRSYFATERVLGSVEHLLVLVKAYNRGVDLTWDVMDDNADDSLSAAEVAAASSSWLSGGLGGLSSRLGMDAVADAFGFTAPQLSMSGAGANARSAKTGAASAIVTPAPLAAAPSPLGPPPLCDIDAMIELRQLAETLLFLTHQARMAVLNLDPRHIAVTATAAVTGIGSSSSAAESSSFSNDGGGDGTSGGAAPSSSSMLPVASASLSWRLWDMTFAVSHIDLMTIPPTYADNFRHFATPPQGAAAGSMTMLAAPRLINPLLGPNLDYSAPEYVLGNAPSATLSDAFAFALLMLRVRLAFAHQQHDTSSSFSNSTPQVGEWSLLACGNDVTRYADQVAQLIRTVRPGEALRLPQLRAMAPPVAAGAAGMKLDATSSLRGKERVKAVDFSMFEAPALGGGGQLRAGAANRTAAGAHWDPFSPLVAATPNPAAVGDAAASPSRTELPSARMGGHGATPVGSSPASLLGTPAYLADVAQLLADDPGQRAELAVALFGCQSSTDRGAPPDLLPLVAPPSSSLEGHEGGGNVLLGRSAPASTRFALNSGAVAVLSRMRQLAVLDGKTKLATLFALYECLPDLSLVTIAARVLPVLSQELVDPRMHRFLAPLYLAVLRKCFTLVSNKSTASGRQTGTSSSSSSSLSSSRRPVSIATASMVMPSSRIAVSLLASLLSRPFRTLVESRDPSVAEVLLSEGFDLLIGAGGRRGDTVLATSNSIDGTDTTECGGAATEVEVGLLLRVPGLARHVASLVDDCLNPRRALIPPLAATGVAGVGSGPVTATPNRSSVAEVSDPLPLSVQWHALRWIAGICEVNRGLLRPAGRTGGETDAVHSIDFSTRLIDCISNLIASPYFTAAADSLRPGWVASSSSAPVTPLRVARAACKLLAPTMAVDEEVDAIAHARKLIPSLQSLMLSMSARNLETVSLLPFVSTALGWACRLCGGPEVALTAVPLLARLLVAPMVIAAPLAIRRSLANDLRQHVTLLEDATTDG